MINAILYTLMTITCLTIFYLSYSIIRDRLNLRRFKREQEQEFLFTYKANLIIIEELELIKDAFPDESKDLIQGRINYRRRVDKSVSNTLTELQLEKL